MATAHAAERRSGAPWPWRALALLGWPDAPALGPDSLALALAAAPCACVGAAAAKCCLRARRLSVWLVWGLSIYDVAMSIYAYVLYVHASCIMHAYVLYRLGTVVLVVVQAVGCRIGVRVRRCPGCPV